MQTRLEPPIDSWPTPTAQRPVWTGHQVALWHPGILAKYQAAAAASRLAGVSHANVVVDQDVYDPLTIKFPQREGDRLSIRTFSLGPAIADVPVGMQPAAALDQVQQRLAALPAEAGVDVSRLREAFAAAGDAGSLAQQLDSVLRDLIESYGQASPSRLASQLMQDEPAVLDQLLGDAPRCAALYNAAVRAFPSAGMSLMNVEPDRVEVPLWALRWMKPRQRVYVDIADSQPMLITEDGEPLGQDVTLAPRALLMTALLRRPEGCACFIHGTGGWDYDRITSQWWEQWQGQALAPIVLATADARLDFGDLPVNTTDDLERAVWEAHHLPHNLDRVMKLDDEAAQAKRELLAHMGDDRDRKRRRSAFALIHQINRELAEQHPQAIAEVQQKLQRARDGVDNAAIARKRDWSFLLYPREELETLRDRVAYGIDQRV